MVNLTEIKAAQKLLQGVINATPCDYSETYSNITGGKIYLKLENLQRTGAFKARGAYNKIAALERKGSCVVTASSGNHAQAVAFAAAKCDRKAIVVMPTTTPMEKVQATKNYGAEVILKGQNFDEANSYAEEIKEESHAYYIHSFDDSKIIAGNGTIALEIFETLPDVQAIVVPVGGGGLISGIAVAAKSLNPDIKIIGVQSNVSNAMKLSIENNQITDLDRVNTIADGVSVKSVCKKTFDITKKYVDELVVVNDEEIASVILMLLDRSKLMVEGAGALSLTAALYGKISLQGMKTVLIISGGNIVMNSLTRIIERGLIKAGRQVNIVVNLSDAPGVLSILTGIIGSFGANIMNIKQQHESFELPFRQTRIDFTLEVNSFEQIDALLKDLRSKGYGVEVKSA